MGRPAHGNMKQKYKTYKEYLAESKPITNHLANHSAMPKFSGGDTPKYRFQQETLKKKGVIVVATAPKYNGLLNNKKIKESFKENK